MALRLSEGLGVASLSMGAGWWESPPGPGHKYAEECVGKSEHPERCLVVEHTLDPVLDEAALIARLSGAHPERGLQLSEGAVLPKPSLKHDDTYCE